MPSDFAKNALQGITVHSTGGDSPVEMSASASIPLQATPRITRYRMHMHQGETYDSSRMLLTWARAKVERCPVGAAQALHHAVDTFYMIVAATDELE